MVKEPKNLHAVNYATETEKALYLFIMNCEWNALFDQMNAKDYALRLKAFLDEEYASGKVYPPREKMFYAFDLVPPTEVKVIILWQDPYHNLGQAMGLSFSVPKGTALPPSLINIYKEVERDLGISMNFHNGDLTKWGKQGVLLLNAYLTVKENQPLSHACKEYEMMLDDVLNYLDTLDQPMVFLLWGGFAKRAAKKVHNPRHLVLTSAHPSPLSANRGGWFGCKHFSRVNQYLSENGLAPIDWRIE